MSSDAKGIVEGLIAAWWRQDVEATLTYFADSIFYTVHDPHGSSARPREIVGKEQMRVHQHGVRETWQFIYLGPTVLVADGGRVRGQILFLSVHRKSGLRYSGTKRFEWRVENGLVTEAAKFHDVGKLKAFLAMADAK